MSRRSLSAVVSLVLALGVLLGTTVAAADAAPHRPPVLGSKSLYQPYGKGWGTVKPRDVDNGGSPSGHVSRVKWLAWGKPNARGFGYGNQFKPGGGYYPRQVYVQFVAKHLSHCYAGGPRAYTVLWARFQKKPGGKFGGWFRWAGLKSICRSS